MSNVLRTTVLLAALTALFLVIGGAIGGNQGLFIAFVFALLMNFASYWFSDKIVLAMYRAREVMREAAQQQDGRDMPIPVRMASTKLARVREAAS